MLREDLGLTGTKYGCGIAQCGACTVHVDGETLRSCAAPVRVVAGRKVTTIEASVTRRQGGAAGLGRPRRRAVRLLPIGPDHVGNRLLEKKPKPTDQDIDRAMAGNICRCATYHSIRAAIHAAAKQLA